MSHYGLPLTAWDDLPRAHALVAAVAHQSFLNRSVDDLIHKLMPGALYVDVKCQADAAALRARGLSVWRL
jgi:UDP-N-acetyl-D-galactosamine dehydrogenase